MADEFEDCPKTLYKYYSSDEYGLEVLKDKNVYASHAYDFNDPFDGTPLLWSNVNFPSKEAVEKLFKEFDIESLQKHLRCLSGKTDDDLKNYFFRRILDTVGIFCLNDGRLKDYQLQEDIFWGYYNEHKGFRIEFDTECMNNLWKIKPFKVNHLEMPQLLHQRLILEKSDLLDEGLFKEKIDKWLTLKKIVWKQENEWRYLFPVNPKQPDQVKARKKEIDLNAIKSITLGYKFFEGNELLDSDGVIFKRRFEQSKTNGSNYSFEILRFLYENNHIPLYQVALTELVSI